MEKVDVNGENDVKDNKFVKVRMMPSTILVWRRRLIMRMSNIKDDVRDDNYVKEEDCVTDKNDVKEEILSKTQRMSKARIVSRPERCQR